MSMLKRFFRIFAILARFWESPGTSKIDKKSKKSCLGRFWDVGAIWGAILDQFLQILDGFWQDLGKILEAFWTDLEGKTMIRATKGKSIDR